MKKYLFYDLEFANQYDGVSKICEFGYVLTDDNFNLIATEEIKIDPQIDSSEWDWWTYENMLHFTKKEYEASLSLNVIEGKIRELFASSDYIFGYSAISDAKGINQDLQRYNLPSLDFEFIDVVLIHKDLCNCLVPQTLSSACQQLSIQCNGNVHIAQVDALLTMQLLRKIFEIKKINLDDYLKDNLQVIDSVKNGEIKSLIKKRQKKYQNLDDLLNGKLSYIDSKIVESLLNAFLSFIPINKNANTWLTGKNICFSDNFEQYHFKDIINIIKLISDMGGKYQRWVDKLNVFVKFNLTSELGEKLICRRQNEIINNDINNIEMISFKDFFNRCNTSYEEISKKVIDREWFINIINKSPKDKIQEIVRILKNKPNNNDGEIKQTNTTVADEKSIWDIVAEKLNN